MPWITVNTDIDIDEFLNECSSYDIEYMIECFIEDGYLDKTHSKKNKKTIVTNNDFQWKNTIEKLILNRHQLTVDEENLITRISQKLV